MNLQDLLEGIIENAQVLEITGLSSDSRTVEQGDLFFAISGNKLKGSDFIKDAITKGAVAVITDEDMEELSVPCYKVENIRKVISIAASRFYPNKLKNIVAVTGTNGKTSVAFFAMQLFEALEEKAASIGTLGVVDKTGVIIEGHSTTPDAISLHKMLHELSLQDYTSVAIEASSHGLEQHRLDNVKIKAAGFTNLTRDHLDYHKTMISYGNAKKRLFYEVLAKDGIAVLNADSDYFSELKDCGRNEISYGQQGRVLRLLSSEILPTGQMIKLSALKNEYNIILSLAGGFQIMNALCAVGLLIGCGFEADNVIPAMSNLIAPSGRLELAHKMENGAKVFIDYAHTPDALENALLSLRPFTEAKLQVVFGCGGDRDAGKRKIMGEIAEKYADVVYVTDDNPRSEEPEAIRTEVLKGAPTKGKNAGDREAAINYAIKHLNKGDVLLIAGKGHENYQIIKDVEYHFDDKEQAIKAINIIEKNNIKE